MVGGDIRSGLDARKARKLRRLTPAQLRERWSTAIASGVMASAAAAKHAVADGPDTHVLLLTAPAQLWHIVPRKSESVRFRWLEEIRDSMHVMHVACDTAIG